MSKTNVIDIRSRLKKREKETPSVSDQPGEVLNLIEKRQAILSQERRQTKRTILTEFIGAFIVIPRAGLQKVALYDISDSGASFDLPKQFGQLKSGEEVAMRIYLSQKNYFGFTVKVANIRYISDEEVYRHGCQFLAHSYNDEALQHFVKFIESVSLNIKVDLGDIVAHNTKK